MGQDQEAGALERWRAVSRKQVLLVVDYAETRKGLAELLRSVVADDGDRVAGGGVRGGMVYGSTDKDAAYALDHPTSPEDLAATIFHQLGIDPKRLDVPGRKRLEVDYGKPIRDIIA